MKKYFSGILIIIIILALFFGGQNSTKGLSFNNEILSSFIDLETESNHVANQLQYQSTVWVGAFDDQLFFYEHNPHSTERTLYDGWLSVFTDGEPKRLARLGHGNILHILGSTGRYLYYWVYQYEPLPDLLYCFDLKQSEEKQVFSGTASFAKVFRFAEDGTVFIPVIEETKNETPCFLHVQADTILERTAQSQAYVCGPYKYILLSDSSNTYEELVQVDEQGARRTIQLGSASHRAVLPTSEGLIIHNEGFSDLLYYIGADGQVKELFHIPCLTSISAISMCGTDLFLSVKRYEKYGEIGMLRYENDALEGTYKISLSDFRTEKISDKIYCGFFHLNDQYLFACDEHCNLDALYADGSRISIKSNP